MGPKDVLIGVAAYGLAQARAELCRRPLSQQDWDWLLARAREERLSGLLTRAIADGALAATPEQADQASSADFSACSLTAALNVVLLEVVDLLVGAGIDYRVLKGSSLARLDYPESSLRSFVDIDLLVPSGQFDHAVGALANAGHARRSPQRRAGFDRRFGKGVMLVTSRGFQIDLHRTLDRGPFGLTIDLSELWTGSAAFQLGGRILHALPLETRFMSVCFHAALGDLPPRLRPLRDVAQILLNGSLDIERVRSLAVSWRAEVVVARAVRLAWDTLGPAGDVPLAVWAGRYRPQPWEARALRVYLDPRRRQVGKSLAAVGFVPGARDKLAYLRAIAFPSRSYLAARDRNYVAHWRQAGPLWRRSAAP